jgi:hypothetical protein
MPLTLLEELTTAQHHLTRGVDQAQKDIGAEQLNNVIVLLKKGYTIDDDVEWLLEEYSDMNQAPEKSKLKKTSTMTTILYRIPDRFFPAVNVKEPFHAKVNYSVKNGKVKIEDVAISPLCMEYIDNLKGLREQMQEDIQAAEARKGIAPVFEQTIKAFAPHI